MRDQTPIHERKAEMQPLATAQTGLLQRQCACGGAPGVDGECEECRSQRLSAQRRASTSSTPAAPPTVPPIVHDVLRSPGQPLDAGTREFMEPRFGHDFSNVRVHTDARAGESAKAVNALAYTVGKDVVFGTGQHAPETSAGQGLMAHELTHVVQQSALSPDAPVTDRSVEEHYEQEADAVSLAFGSIGENWQGLIAPLPVTVSPIPGGVQTTPVQYKKKPAPTASTEDTDVNQLVSHTIEVIVAIAQPLVGQAMLGGSASDKKETFSTVLQTIKEQIEAPKSQAPKGKEHFAELYQANIVTELDKLQHLSGKEKVKAVKDVYAGVHSKLLEDLPEITGTDFKQEYEELTKEELRKKQEEFKKKQKEFERKKKLLTKEEREKEKEQLTKEKLTKEELDMLAKAPGIAGGLDNYISFIRPALIATFGSFSSVKHFFEKEIQIATFLGHSVPVHKEMKSRLEKAEKLLKSNPQSQWQDIAKSIRHILSFDFKDAHGEDAQSVGSLEVRANTTQPTELSKHALGLAIDINAESNPHFLRHPHMFATFPAELIEELSGQSLRQDLRNVYVAIHHEEPKKRGESKKPGRPKIPTMQEVSESIDNVLIASQVFQSQAKIVFKDENSLKIRLLKYLREHGDVDFVKDTTTLIDLFKIRAEEVQALQKAQKANDKKDAENKMNKTEESIRSVVSSIKVNLRQSKEQSSAQFAQQAEDVGNVLLQASDVFAYTRNAQGQFINPKAAEETSATKQNIESTPAIAAMHGFFDLRAELVAALVDWSGGGLNWLGASTGTKDFMHFEVPSTIELPRGDYPVLEDDEKHV